MVANGVAPPATAPGNPSASDQGLSKPSQPAPPVPNTPAVVSAPTESLLYKGETLMVSRTLTKAVLGTLTAAALSIGTLAGATTAAAAPAQKVPTRTAAILAVNNLGLTTWEAQSVQCYVRDAAPVGKYNPGARLRREWAASVGQPA